MTQACLKHTLTASYTHTASEVSKMKSFKIQNVHVRWRECKREVKICASLQRLSEGVD